jgi:hypothetical protein
MDCEPDIACPSDPEPGNLVEIAVNDQAQVDKPCVRIAKGRTEVVWKGGANVARLEVKFKHGPQGKPVNPSCEGAECKLTRAAQGLARGRFCYEVFVERTDGTTAVVDPVLIINP